MINQTTKYYFKSIPCNSFIVSFHDKKGMFLGIWLSKKKDEAGGRTTKTELVKVYNSLRAAMSDIVMYLKKYKHKIVQRTKPNKIEYGYIVTNVVEYE